MHKGGYIFTCTSAYRGLCIHMYKCIQGGGEDHGASVARAGGNTEDLGRRAMDAVEQVHMCI